MGKNTKYARPTWDEYFIEVMDAVSKRATCDRGRSGAVIERDHMILTTGYVGSPAGLPHCDNVGHLMKKVIHDDGHISEHCKRTIHAETNAILQAAKHGVPITDATIYCRMTPCRDCAMLIVNCGIKKVVAQRDYHESGETKEIFKSADVVLEIIEGDVENYDNQGKVNN